MMEVLSIWYGINWKSPDLAENALKSWKVEIEGKISFFRYNNTIDLKCVIRIWSIIFNSQFNIV